MNKNEINLTQIKVTQFKSEYEKCCTVMKFLELISHSPVPLHLHFQGSSLYLPDPVWVPVVCSQCPCARNDQSHLIPNTEMHTIMKKSKSSKFYCEKIR